MGEGFESHWDAGWFRHKAKQCRELASFVPDMAMRTTLEEMAADLEAQGDVAEYAAMSVRKGAG